MYFCGSELINASLLDHYVSKYKLTDLFQTNMKPYMKLVHFKRNSFICKSEEHIDKLYFFVEGKAKVYTSTSNGKSLLLCFYKPMMLIGDAEILVFKEASTNLQVIEDSLCVAIDFADLHLFALDDAVFLRYLTMSLGSKLLRLSKYSSINILYPLENRLASYLLNILSVEGGPSEDKHNLTELAELLGTSYRHLLRTLNKLVSLGTLSKDGGFYRINDRDLLSAMAADLYD